MSAVTLDRPPGPVRGFLRLVVIEHSVFALPFAYIAALDAMRHDIEWRDLAAVTTAMVAARTFAMAANRLIDREIDARNPRTAQRELVTGALSVQTVVAGMAASFAALLLAAWYLAPICLVLAPVAVLPLVVYPYTKRFTWLCHYVLGFAQAIAPVGAWVAIQNGFDDWTPSIWLGLAVGTWIAGFDLIYACQDIDSDRANGIHSLPARFGARVALRVSLLTHVVTVAMLVAFGLAAHRGLWWWAGVALTEVALAYEHSIVQADDLSRVNRAFFTVNGWVGVGLLAFAIVDRVV